MDFNRIKDTLEEMQLLEDAITVLSLSGCVSQEVSNTLRLYANIENRNRRELQKQLGSRLARWSKEQEESK